MQNDEIQPFKIAREAAGLTVIDVETQTKIPKDSLYKYDLGEQMPGTGRLKKLADLYGVSVAYLKTGKDATAPNEVSQWKEMFNELKAVVLEMRDEMKGIKNTQGSQQELINKVMGKSSDKSTSGNVFFMSTDRSYIQKRTGTDD